METRIATLADTGPLMPFVRAYHEFEGISTTDSERARAVEPLLHDDSGLGRIWLIEASDQLVGYIALCFGYSIEFGGRDAFVDEFYIAESSRGRGIGGRALQSVKAEMARMGVRVLHLEVAASNVGAKQFYAKAGFVSRDRFHLMSCELDAE